MPNLDGFSLSFFQTCWDVRKEDLMEVFYELFSFGKFEKSIYATFLAFIPKKSEVSEVNDFGRISLVNEVYMIISKVISNRLGVVLGTIINKPQNIFFQGRQIANEYLDSKLKSGPF